MLKIIMENMTIIAMLFGLFGLFLFSNTMFGLYLNTNINKEKFEWSRLWAGILRGFILIFGVASLVIGVSTIGVVITNSNLVNIDASIIDGISIVAMSTIIVIGMIDYAKQSMEKFNKIMKNENIEETNIKKKEI